MNTPHEVPTDPSKLHRYAVADQLDHDHATDDIDAPRYQLVSETVTADGRRIRHYSNRPTTKENPTMTKPTSGKIGRTYAANPSPDYTHTARQENPTMTDPTTLAGILSSLTAAPVRHLTTIDAEAWSEATAELGGWLNTDGSPLLITTAEKLTNDLLAAAPSTPRPLARVKVQRALSALVAKTNLRLGTAQFGDDTGTDPVAVLMACPDGTRLAADGFEAVVVIWYPDGTYDFTDDLSGDRVSIPSLYKGTAAGYARMWRNIDDAVATFDELKGALRTLRRLSNVDQHQPDDDIDGGKPSAATSIV